MNICPLAHHVSRHAAIIRVADIPSIIVRAPMVPTDTGTPQPSPSTRPELNELVKQAIIFLRSFVHEGAMIQCDLSEEELYIAADGPKVTEALFCLLECTINAWNHLPPDLKVSKRVVINTGIIHEKSVFLDVYSECVPAFNIRHDTVWEGIFIANLILRQGHAHAERILDPVGGRLVIASLKDNRAQGTKISVELPRWAAA